jgi:hypothetical protein
MTYTIAFPLQDTLGDLRFRPTEHFLGAGIEQLYLGIRAQQPDSRYLFSITARTEASNARMQRLRSRAFTHVEGIFDVEFIGPFDRVGVDPVRDAEREGHWGMVEKLPEGEPLSRLGLGSLGPRRAVELGAAVGRILARGVHAGVVLVGLRPEYVWARRSAAAGASVTGVGGRSHEFFAAARPFSLPTAPLFERLYAAPEVMRGDPAGERALVFTLAIMVAEWATDRYPFPDSWARGSALSLATGKHAPLGVSKEVDDLLSTALRAEAGERPALDAFIAQLDQAG